MLGPGVHIPAPDTGVRARGERISYLFMGARSGPQRRRHVGCGAHLLPHVLAAGWHAVSPASGCDKSGGLGRPPLRGPVTEVRCARWVSQQETSGRGWGGEHGRSSFERDTEVRGSRSPSCAERAGKSLTRAGGGSPQWSSGASSDIGIRPCPSPCPRVPPLRPCRSRRRLDPISSPCIRRGDGRADGLARSGCSCAGAAAAAHTRGIGPDPRDHSAEKGRPSARGAFASDTVGGLSVARWLTGHGGLGRRVDGGWLRSPGLVTWPGWPGGFAVGGLASRPCRAAGPACRRPAGRRRGQGDAGRCEKQSFARSILENMILHTRICKLENSRIARDIPPDAALTRSRRGPRIESF